MPLARRHLVPALVAATALTVAFESARVFAGPDEPGKSGTVAAEATSQRVDALLEKAWKDQEVTARPLAPDAEFLRRVTLDLTGVIPTEEATRAFLESTSPAKRRDLVRALLQDPGYGRSMGTRWAYLLVGRDYLLRMQQGKRAQNLMRLRQGRRARMEEAMSGESPAMDGAGMGAGKDEAAYEDEEYQTLTEWLGDELLANRPWDELTRELIAAEGRADRVPAAHYMLRYTRDGKAEEMTGSVMRVFQGLQLQCAQCHDHHTAKWTQRDFYGIAAYFARTNSRRLPAPDDAPKGPDGKPKKKGPYMVFERPSGQIRIPAEPGVTGPLVLPTFVDGRVTPPGGGVNRRAALAELITADDNPYFARATVNRVWSFFFGRGIVDPVDDFDEGEAAVPGLLELLSDDFRQSGYDMRRLIEVIVSTQAYQRTSAGPLDNKEQELALFARAPLRALSAEQLFYSVLEATGMEDLRGADPRRFRRLEQQKFQLMRKFLTTFADDEMQEVVEEGTIPQALLRFNGTLTNEAIRPRPGHPVYDRLFRTPEVDERIQIIYLRALGRRPTEEERAVLRTALAEAKGAAALATTYADVYWALLNSSEFNFIH